MKQATVRLTGKSPYAQSRFHGTEKKNKETPDAYESRTWPNKVHAAKGGEIFIPAFALKKCVQEAAKYLSVQVPGKGKATYTKHFKSGVLVLNHAYLLDPKGKPILKEHIEQDGGHIGGEWIFVNSDGVSGSGKRVNRCFPLVQAGWFCDVDYTIADDLITEDVFAETMRAAGNLIGLGAFRVGNGSIWGRFDSEVISWVEHDAIAA